MTNKPASSSKKYKALLKIKLLQAFFWLKNLFTKKGRQTNFFASSLKNIKKAATKKFQTKRQAKQELIDYVRSLQHGPKKSHWEIYQLCLRKGIKVDKEGNIYSFGLMGNLKQAGVKVDWQKMKFID